jgi:hypothetical protein
LSFYSSWLCWLVQSIRDMNLHQQNNHPQSYTSDRDLFLHYGNKYQNRNANHDGDDENGEHFVCKAISLSIHTFIYSIKQEQHE